MRHFFSLKNGDDAILMIHGHEKSKFNQQHREKWKRMRESSRIDTSFFCVICITSPSFLSFSLHCFLILRVLFVSIPLTFSRVYKIAYYCGCCSGIHFSDATSYCSYPNSRSSSHLCHAQVPFVHRILGRQGRT